MSSSDVAVQKAQRATIGFGGLSVAVGVLMLGLGLFGGDGSAPASTWLVQGMIISLFGGVMLFFGKRLTLEAPLAKRALQVLSWLMYLSLGLGALSIISGDYSVVLSMLIAALLVSYYWRAQHSL